MTLEEALQEELQNPLPGRIAQLIMMPKGRDLSVLPTVKRDAAVSIVLYISYGDDSKEILFIKRTAYNGPHSDQVSFPGGKYEKVDASLMNTAIRECNEEIGLQLEPANLAGTMTPLYIAISQYMVYPYIFIYNRFPKFKTNPKEVSYVIRFPVMKLLEEELKQKTILTIENQKIEAPYYAINNEIVWGATAMMLSEFIEILRRIKKKNPELL